jgi:ADP-heptose:LPS heptosyltransferase
MKHKITPVLVGTQAESTVLSTIESICREVINLQGKTNFNDLAEMARGALFTIGNDTGPMHLVAVAGCQCLVLFSNSSNPELCVPFGEKVNVMRREPLADLPPDDVIAWIQKRI